MAFSYIYRRFFEVELLHGFYLDRSAAEPYWNLSDNQKAVALGAYDIGRDLDIVPTPETAAALKNFRILFKKTPLGFMAGIEVKEATGADNRLLSLPVIPIPDDFVLRFRLVLRNPWFWNFTHSRLRPSLPGKFYFTNHASDGQRVFPDLAIITPDHLPGKWYELGERVATDTGLVYEAQMKTNSIPGDAGAPWSLVDLHHFYLTDQDRNLIPSRIAYSFPAESGATHADFHLQKDGADAIPIQAFDNPAGLRQVDLDFHSAAPGSYQLVVTCDDGYADTMPVVINDELYLGKIDQLSAPLEELPGANPDNRFVKAVNRSERQQLSKTAQETAGILEIRHQPGLDRYRLLEDGGHLRMEGPPGNQVRTPPVFRLSLRARPTYWHYIHSSGFAGISNVAGDVALRPVDGQNRLVSLLPHPLLNDRSREIKLAYEIDGAPVVFREKKLPNPDNYVLKECEQRTKICSEIFLNGI